MPKKQNTMQKSDQSDPHVSVSFSLPLSVKEEMDRRAKRLRITRSDYLKFMVLWELDKGADAPFDMPRTPTPAAATGDRHKNR
jgi:hypothetical protein